MSCVAQPTARASTLGIAAADLADAAPPPSTLAVSRLPRFRAARRSLVAGSAASLSARM